MWFKPMKALLLMVGAALAGTGVVASASPEPRCSPVGGIPRDGYDPAPVVAAARVIVRARADSATGTPSGPVRGPGPQGSVHFTVLEVIDSGGLSIPASLRISGYLAEQPDFNTKPLPYRWVRSDGLRGSCVAHSYQRGGEFLLLLQGKDAASLDPYWAGLRPTNEQVRGATDPWVTWVRDARRTGQK